MIESTTENAESPPKVILYFQTVTRANLQKNFEYFFNDVWNYIPLKRLVEYFTRKCLQ